MKPLVGHMRRFVIHGFALALSLLIVQIARAEICLDSRISARQVELRSMPKESAKVLCTLNDGQEIKWLKEQEGWDMIAVELPGPGAPTLVVGWIPDGNTKPRMYGATSPETCQLLAAGGVNPSGLGPNGEIPGRARTGRDGETDRTGGLGWGIFNGVIVIPTAAVGLVAPLFAEKERLNVTFERTISLASARWREGSSSYRAGFAIGIALALALGPAFLGYRARQP